MLPNGHVVSDTVLGADGLASARPRGSLLIDCSSAEPWLTRETAVLELSCSDGVYSERCLRLVAQLCDALERQAELFTSVRSLANARVVRAEQAVLRLEPLA